MNIEDILDLTNSDTKREFIRGLKEELSSIYQLNSQDPYFNIVVYIKSSLCVKTLNEVSGKYENLFSRDYPLLARLFSIDLLSLNNETEIKAYLEIFSLLFSSTDFIDIITRTPRTINSDIFESRILMLTIEIFAETYSDDYFLSIIFDLISKRFGYYERYYLSRIVSQVLAMYQNMKLKISPDIAEKMLNLLNLEFIEEGRASENLFERWVYIESIDDEILFLRMFPELYISDLIEIINRLRDFEDRFEKEISKLILDLNSTVSNEFGINFTAISESQLESISQNMKRELHLPQPTYHYLKNTDMKIPGIGRIIQEVANLSPELLSKLFIQISDKQDYITNEVKKYLQ